MGAWHAVDYPQGSGRGAGASQAWQGCGWRGEEGAAGGHQGCQGDAGPAHRPPASYQLESPLVFASGPDKLRRRITISSSENNLWETRGMKVTTLPNGVFFLKVIVTGLRLINLFCLTSAISLTGTVMSWR